MVAKLVLVLCTLTLSGAVLAAPPGDEAKQLYLVNCAGCHKWDGHGGGGYGGAALSLRETQLDLEQIVTTVGCGRPGTGMPYHLRDAYTTAHPCYGFTATAALGKEAPLEADHFLRPAEIAEVADYVVATIKGRGEATFAECQAFYGTGSRVCDVYRNEPKKTADAGEDDLRQFSIGMKAGALPNTGYTDFACAQDPAHKLDGWAGYAGCPSDKRGLHEVAFRYDRDSNPGAYLGDRYRGTRVGGHPVLIALLFDDGGSVAGIRIATDPDVRLYERKKAFLFAGQVKARYGAQGWHCTDAEPRGDREPIGGVFIDKHCEKTTPTRRLLLDQQLYRRADRPIEDFVSAAEVTILPSAQGDARK
ncbi:MAG: hypothetical protein ABI369_14830 [Acetobacteraceae bacterium]